MLYFVRHVLTLVKLMNERRKKNRAYVLHGDRRSLIATRSWIIWEWSMREDYYHDFDSEETKRHTLTINTSLLTCSLANEILLPRRVKGNVFHMQLSHSINRRFQSTQKILWGYDNYGLSRWKVCSLETIELFRNATQRWSHWEDHQSREIIFYFN